MTPKSDFEKIKKNDYLDIDILVYEKYEIKRFSAKI